MISKPAKESDADRLENGEIKRRRPLTASIYTESNAV